jgi:adenosylhomocysteinase
MDMSFSIQALCAEHIVKNNGSLPVGVVDVPEEIDKKVALRKLNSWGTEIDRLTDEQEKYINSWNV